MVDVQAVSAKIVDRATRIIMEVTRTDKAVAQEALKRAGGSAKVAIVMLMKGMERAEAVALLEKNGGFLRRVLEGTTNQ
jgi:N-acetylmuramic acid 6-phosphate etherase